MIIKKKIIKKKMSMKQYKNNYRILLIFKGDHMVTFNIKSDPITHL